MIVREKVSFFFKKKSSGSYSLSKYDLKFYGIKKVRDLTIRGPDSLRPCFRSGASPLDILIEVAIITNVNL